MRSRFKFGLRVTLGGVGREAPLLGELVALTSVVKIGLVLIERGDGGLSVAVGIGAAAEEFVMGADANRCRSSVEPGSGLVATRSLKCAVCAIVSPMPGNGDR